MTSVPHHVVLITLVCSTSIHTMVTRRADDRRDPFKMDDP